MRDTGVTRSASKTGILSRATRSEPAKPNNNANLGTQSSELRTGSYNLDQLCPTLLAQQTALNKAQDYTKGSFSCDPLPALQSLRKRYEKNRLKKRSPALPLLLSSTLSTTGNRRRKASVNDLDYTPNRFGTYPNDVAPGTARSLGDVILLTTYESLNVIASLPLRCHQNVAASQSRSERSDLIPHKPAITETQNDIALASGLDNPKPVYSKLLNQAGSQGANH
ncbi:hypothetical protein F511_09082 [Dorcoceras hygrometricum]|nr:hypothetical protein F511_09082 [Dorcoceras hygrometricum]